MKKIQTYNVKKIILFCICFVVSATVTAESMSGTTYTLNGSIGVIVNQGESSTYTLDSSGNPIGTGNSSGATYTLYPTPYSGTSNPGGGSGEQQQTSGQSGRAVGGMFGGEIGPQFVPTILFPENTVTEIGKSETTEKEKLEIFSNAEAYKTYTYSDTVRFGQRTSTTSESQDVPLKIPWSLVWIIFLGGILLGLEIWKNFHKNKI